MDEFREITRRIVEKARRAVSLRDRMETPVPREVQLIAGMPSAPEPCALFDHWKPELHPTDAIGQLKVNGIRALYIGTVAPHSGPHMVTRQAQPLNCALHCLPALQRLEKRFGEPMVFDGEYQAVGGFDATLAEQKAGIGSGVFWLFDAVPYREWAANRFAQPLRRRLMDLSAMDFLDEPFLGFLEPFPLAGPVQARAIAASFWRQGQEGIVVKDAGSRYWRGRQKKWLKLKKRLRFDAIIIDHAEKDGRITAVMVETKEHGIQKVGTMPAAMRQGLTSAPMEWIGTALEVGFTDTNDTGRLMGGFVARWKDQKGEWHA